MTPKLEADSRRFHDLLAAGAKIYMPVPPDPGGTLWAEKEVPIRDIAHLDELLALVKRLKEAQKR